MALFNITNKIGTASIKPIKVSDTGFDSCSEAITTDFNTDLWHNGALDYPVPGDIVYKDSIGVVRWTSTDEAQDRRIQIHNRNLKVNAQGVVQITC